YAKAEERYPFLCHDVFLRYRTKRCDVAGWNFQSVLIEGCCDGVFEELLWISTDVVVECCLSLDEQQFRISHQYGRRSSLRKYVGIDDGAVTEVFRGNFTG